MPELTPLEAAEKLEETANGYRAITMWEKHVEAMRFAAIYLRKIAAGELVPALVRCIDCAHIMPLDLSAYPDIICHLHGRSFRVRADMSCSCAERGGKDDSHESH